MYSLTCPSCKSKFTAFSPDAIYCSAQCKKRAGKKRYVKKQANERAKKIAVLDFETDPFKHGRSVAPFAYGLMLETGEYYSAWDTDSKADFIQSLLDQIDKIAESHIIYAHNGGRFDFFFLLDKIYSHIPSVQEDKKGFFLIQNRITRIAYKQHEFRDSYSIMPVPLKTSGNKLEMDYSKMEKTARNKHRAEIDIYLKQDCQALLDMVIQYRDVFGKSGKIPLTMASAAFKALKDHHEFTPISRQMDANLRDYYAGGHTQCYDVGIITAPENDDICLFDVNSEYPSVMKFNQHPTGDTWYSDTKITDNTHFVEWQGVNHAAVYSRDKTGIHFNHSEGTFKTTIHEYTTALELGLIEVDTIIETLNCKQSTNFAAFVDEYFNRRLESAANNDATLVLFWKLVLNSSYGKFGQNADNFGNYTICEKGNEEYLKLLSDESFKSAIDIETEINGKQYSIVKTALSDAELDEQAIYNVATAASITGAARALLMRGIHCCNSTGNKVLYCDTDSMFTYGLPAALEIVKDKTLGKWNFEAKGKIIVLAGKKQYALFDRLAADVLNSPTLLSAYPKYKWTNETLEQFACRYKSSDYKPPKGFAYIPDALGNKTYWACCKMATKGTRLCPQEIVNMAYDATYTPRYDNFAPTFDLNANQRFISRITRNTAEKPFTLGKKEVFIPSLSRSIKREFENSEYL